MYADRHVGDWSIKPGDLEIVRMSVWHARLKMGVQSHLKRLKLNQKFVTGSGCSVVLVSVPGTGFGTDKKPPGL